MASLPIFPMKGFLQTEPFKAKVLTLSEAGGLYNVIAYTSASLEEETKSGLAHGWYDFVVLPESPEVCWVRREWLDREAKYRKRPEKLDGTPRLNPGSSRGHSSIAQGKDVLWAGKILFTGGPCASDGLKPGSLKIWDNTSGHYMKSAANMSQSKVRDIAEAATARLKAKDGSRLLPMERFQPWDGDM